MDVKDIQNEASLGERNNDGSKYASGGVTLPYSRNKSYQDVSSVSLGKVDAHTSRPCAVIGPDRVLPPPVSNDTLKRSAYEAWYADSVYRHPPEYPHKMTNYHTPIRNISPRQTFQENMQRIMVPPTYNTLKGNEEHHFPMDKNVSLPKNTKSNIPLDTKYCEVPYSGSLTSNEQKSVRNTEQCASNMNPVLARSVPQGWPAHVRPPRPYGAPELYQYPEYTNCAGPRPVPMSRPHRTTHEDPNHGYPDPYCHDGSIRFKPYSTVKDRYPQSRYDFIGNYPSPFHPPSAFPPHKYDMPKSIPQPYAYPQVPLKYLDSRIPDPLIDGYQRQTQQNNYNLPFHNQMIHPAYGPVIGNCIQNKFPCPPEGSVKSVAPNKPPYDANKMYAEYENARTKGFPVSENYYFNEMQRPPHHIKSQMMPNYPVNMHGIPPHPYYRKDSATIKNYEYMPHFRNIDPSLLSQSRIPSQFSPNAITISPPDTNLTLESTHIQGSTQEDCGYVSQSPTATIRNVDYVNRSANEFYRRYDSRYGPTIRPPPMMAKPDQNLNANSKEKKDIDVRQFLQMWNEVDDENAENANKEAVAQLLPCDVKKPTSQYENAKNQDQLYVLGLVNVPSEELAKYEHIQKVSKLPENIKGYNSIELLNQFEEVIESSNVNNFKIKSSNPRDMNYQMSMKNPIPNHPLGLLPRPVSPLDVEAKISQSVIHKEVGCNFEIKPCSPKMLNVEAATPIQNLLSERAIEKVSNPLIATPSILHEEDKSNCNILTRQEQMKSSNENLKNTSCKMTNTQFKNNDSVRPDYSIQDLESNSGVCLASLPRLDNDIELNFPEVNQQFINANKGESVITTTKDLPSLMNIDHSESNSPKIESNLREESDTNCEFPSIIDSEREFSKLSKYRKVKKFRTEILEKETPSFTSTQNMRTDSVIIKNPENSKIFDLSRDVLSADSLPLTEDKVILNEENFVSEVSANKDVSNKLDHSAIDTPMDIAIDFSLNKNDSNNTVSSATNYYIGNRFKSPKVNKTKHRHKMTQIEKNCQTTENNTQPEPQQISDAGTPKKYKIDNESKQMQESHDNHETKTEKSTIVIDQQINKRSESSMYKNNGEINEEKPSELKSEVDNDVNPTENENESVTKKIRYKNKNYEYRKEIQNFDVNAVNDNEDFNISKHIDIKDNYDSTHFKEDNIDSLTSHINKSVHKSGSFELFSDESDEYETDSNINEINKMQEKSGIIKDNDNNEIVKIETINTIKNKGPDDIEAKIDTNDITHDKSIFKVSDVEDETNETFEKKKSVEINDATHKVQNKSHIEDNRNETKVIAITDNTIEIGEEVKNSVENFNNEIYEAEQTSNVEKNITQTVTEDIDIEEDIHQLVRKLNTEEDTIKNDIKDETDKKDVTEIYKGNEKFDIETNLNESIEMEENHKTVEIDEEVTSAKSTNTENVEIMQESVNLLSKNKNSENSLETCEISVNVSDKLPEEFNSNENGTLNSLTDISHGKKFLARESVNHEISSISSETFENNKISENGNLVVIENEDLHNFSAKIITLTMNNDSLMELVTSENAPGDIQMDLETKDKSEFNENYANSSPNGHLENFRKSTNLTSTCEHQNIAPKTCEDFLKSSTESLVQSNKQISTNDLPFDENIQNEYKRIEEIQTNLFVNAIKVNNRGENIIVQHHEDVDKNNDNESSCRAKEFLETKTTTPDSLLKSILTNNSTFPNKSSNQSQSLFTESRSVVSCDEDANRLPHPFSNSLYMISPLNSDEDSSNSPHHSNDLSNETGKLDHNDKKYYSTTNTCAQNIIDQYAKQSNVPSLGKDLVRKQFKDQNSSNDLKNTNLKAINDDIEDEESNPVKIYKNDCKVRLGLKKELFSPFIRKLITHNIGYTSNVHTNINTINAVCNYRSTSNLTNDVVEQINHDSAVSREDVNKASKNISKNVDITSDDTISKEINKHEEVDDDYGTKISSMVLANCDIGGSANDSLKSPVRNSKESIKNCSCPEGSENVEVNTQTKLISDATSLTNDSILFENSAHDISILSPNCNLEGMEIADNVDNLERYKPFDQKLEDNASEPSVVRETQIDVEFTSNNEFNIEEALNVEASQDLGSHKYIESSNRSCLKRSLSDSALDSFNESNEAFYSGWQPKRSKKKFRNIVDPNMMYQPNCQNHRRKSISSVYNEQNLSFCILIDNDCIITEEENEEQDEVCFTEISEGCITDLQESTNEYYNVASPNIVDCPEKTNHEYLVAQGNEDGKSYEESWVDDVGCIETVVSDVAEDITISASSSPDRIHSPENDESGIFLNSEHTDKVKHIYGDKMCNDDIMFLETLYRTPQMNVNKVINRESQISDECIQYYNKDSLEKVLSGCNSHDDVRSDEEPLASDATSFNLMDSAQGTNMQLEEQLEIRSSSPTVHFPVRDTYNKDGNYENVNDESLVERPDKTQDDTVHSCESSIDNVFSYNQKEHYTTYTSSTSPEVSSTTSEERNSGILLKITNYKGSRISQINDFEQETKSISCKFTELNDYSSSQNFKSNRPLITKAAQKYIPPLKETFGDLKIRLPLPQHSLLRLKQLKLLKEESKPNKCNVKSKPNIPKKPKPKFEDVLKSIDELQFKMHKEKSKKTKKSIPKVVIKKNENGSHYASTTNMEPFNPDLTGRKWQPWVFIEKDYFIDKMALRNKRKAIFNHRKNTYVLAEKFRKYKSIGNAKFIISQPNLHNSSIGHLKCTIRLKHSY